MNVLAHAYSTISDTNYFFAVVSFNCTSISLLRTCYILLTLIDILPSYSSYECSVFSQTVQLIFKPLSVFSFYRCAERNSAYSFSSQSPAVSLNIDFFTLSRRLTLRNPQSLSTILFLLLIRCVRALCQEKP